MSETQSIKLCLVCGDKAFVKNFCVFTCESCKVFFRRNASKVEEYKCVYRNNCAINLETRKRCRKCRIEKCFDVGMKKEWILSEEEKKNRNEIIEENRKKRKQFDVSNKEEMSSSKTIITDISFNTITSEIMNNETDQQNKQNSIEENQEFIDFESELVPIMRPLTDYNNNLTESEGIVFTELLDATKFLTVLVSTITSEVETHSEAMGLIATYMETNIRKIIKTAKSLIGFRNICSADQLTLIKYGGVEMTYMMSMFIYEQDQEYLTYTLDENSSFKVSLDVFRQKSIEHYIIGKSCIDKLVLLSDWDQIILYLMMAIVLFNPTRPQLVDRQQIKYQQQVYMHLLKRYLLLKYCSETESESRFVKLVRLIPEVNCFQERVIRQIFAKQPLDYIGYKKSPLLKELYYEGDQDNSSKIFELG